MSLCDLKDLFPLSKISVIILAPAFFFPMEGDANEQATHPILYVV